MALRDDLIAAKALIDTPEKWAKHWSKTGPMCVVRALQEKVGIDVPAPSIPAYEAICAALPASHTAKYGRTSAGTYNDAPTTAHADVMALFDRAIASVSP